MFKPHHDLLSKPSFKDRLQTFHINQVFETVTVNRHIQAILSSNGRDAKLGNSPVGHVTEYEHKTDVVVWVGGFVGRIMRNIFQL